MLCLAEGCTCCVSQEGVGGGCECDDARRRTIYLILFNFIFINMISLNHSHCCCHFKLEIGEFFSGLRVGRPRPDPLVVHFKDDAFVLMSLQVLPRAQSRDRF